MLPNCLLTVVSPVYQAEAFIDEFIRKLKTHLCSITNEFEIVLVEDGSYDRTWEKIAFHCSEDPRLKGILLSRNFGQHAAIAAGLQAAKGEWVVVMDCDLQDLPEAILSLYQKALAGYDIVVASRIKEHTALSSLLCSKLFYRLLSWTSGMKYDSAIGNFGIYHRKIIPHLLHIHPCFPYFPAMVQWVGFKRATIPVIQAKRLQGKSSYTLPKKAKLALQILIAYSDHVLRWVMGFGIVISLVAFLFAVFTFYNAVTGKIQVIGYASLVISISFFSGVIIFTLGVIGLFIGKLFESSKIKPMYLIEKNLNDA